jgi:hypothetical protein
LDLPAGYPAEKKYRIGLSKDQEAVLIIEASTKRTPEEFSDAYGPSHIKQAHIFQKKEIRKGKADAQSTH